MPSASSAATCTTPAKNSGLPITVSPSTSYTKDYRLTFGTSDATDTEPYGHVVFVIWSWDSQAHLHAHVSLVILGRCRGVEVTMSVMTKPDGSVHTVTNGAVRLPSNLECESKHPSLSPLHQRGDPNMTIPAILSHTMGSNLSLLQRMLATDSTDSDRQREREREEEEEEEEEGLFKAKAVRSKRE